MRWPNISKGQRVVRPLKLTQELREAAGAVRQHLRACFQGRRAPQLGGRGRIHGAQARLRERVGQKGLV